MTITTPTPTDAPTHALYTVASKLLRLHPRARHAVIDYDGAGSFSLGILAVENEAGEKIADQYSLFANLGDDAYQALSEVREGDILGHPWGSHRAPLRHPGMTHVGPGHIVLDLHAVTAAPRPTRTPAPAKQTVTLELDAKQAATLLGILDCSKAWHTEWNTYVRDNGDYTREEAQAADDRHDAEDTLASVLRSVVTHTFPEAVTVPGLDAPLPVETDHATTTDSRVHVFVGEDACHGIPTSINPDEGDEDAARVCFNSDEDGSPLASVTARADGLHLAYWTADGGQLRQVTAAVVPYYL